MNPPAATGPEGDYDVVVVGLGALGSFALRELARRGMRTLGVDRFDPPHARGSSHGRSRIIRTAYFEHPLYVPLVQEAWTEWEALEREAGETLLRPIGALMVGPRAGGVVEGTLASAEHHALRHRVYTPSELQREFPLVRIPSDHVAVHEERVGVLLPERAIGAALRSARAHGAEIRTGTPLSDWTAHESHVTLWLGDQRIHARHAVLAAGPWLPEVTAMGGSGLLRPIRVERQVSFWYNLPTPATPDRGGPTQDGTASPLRPKGLPVLLWEFEPEEYMYLIPDLGDGLKVAMHHGGATVDPDRVPRNVGPHEDTRVRTLLERLLPGVVGSLSDASVCLYTNTPDGHFLVGPLPGSPRVLLLGGGSGHAFKFAPALGRRVADHIEGNAVGCGVDARGPTGPDPFSPLRLNA